MPSRRRRARTFPALSFIFTPLRRRRRRGDAVSCPPGTLTSPGPVMCHLRRSRRSRGPGCGSRLPLARPQSMGRRPGQEKRGNEHGEKSGEEGVCATRLEARPRQAAQGRCLSEASQQERGLPHLPLKVGASAKPRSKSEVFRTIAQHAGIHRRDVAAVFHVMGSMIKADLSKSGPGVFQVPGLMRITVKRKPATKERMGINPFTKEQVMFKAKPARNVVRVRPLQGLKAMV